MYTLSCNDEEFAIDSLNALRTQLARVKGGGCWDIWLQKDNDSSLCTLVNGASAWLIYFPDKDGTSYSTRNPTYSGPPKAVISYTLSNGQVDEYPAAWDITTDEALRALEHFFVNGVGMTPALTWHKDY